MAVFSKLKPALRSAQVREHLEASIERGDYRAGDRLPSERELTEIFGVSRVSVREAICSLEAMGLVDVRHGHGCFVTEPSGNQGARWLALHHGEALELLTVRGALDELAAREAAARASDVPGDGVGVAAIRAAHEAFAAAAKGGAGIDELSALDIAFHTTVAEASGSPLLANLLRDLHRHSADVSRAHGYMPAERSARSAREHLAILEGIAAGDAQHAGAAAAAHLARARALVVAAVGHPPGA
jgi:GntR family transcriptional repressor for pyruvate dehydrogenase complex